MSGSESKTETPRVRHPEKAHKPDQEDKRKPAWIRVKAPVSSGNFTAWKTERLVTMLVMFFMPSSTSAVFSVPTCWLRP